MIIAGIGSRKTPVDVQTEMTQVGEWCRSKKIWVRSGHAEGADWAFEQGAQEYCIAYLPWFSFNKELKSRARMLVPDFTRDIELIARQFHPIYPTLKDTVKKLMMRNVCQVLGQNVNTPVSAVICYTEDSLLTSGGTSQAMRIAKARGIPTFNMAAYRADAVINILSEMHNAFCEKHITG